MDRPISFSDAKGDQVFSARAKEPGHIDAGPALGKTGHKAAVDEQIALRLHALQHQHKLLARLRLRHDLGVIGGKQRFVGGIPVIDGDMGIRFAGLDLYRGGKAVHFGEAPPVQLLPGADAENLLDPAGGSDTQGTPSGIVEIAVAPLLHQGSHLAAARQNHVPACAQPGKNGLAAAVHR